MTEGDRHHMLAPYRSRARARIGRRQLICAAAAVCWVAHSRAQAGTTAPEELQLWLPSAQLSGSTRFRYWGFAVYDASLWVQPGFRPQQFERHDFALQLHYLRDFTNAAITGRSVDEMARQTRPTSARRQQWIEWLQGAFPDVHVGDRITGINRPGVGVLFFTNGRQTGKVSDTSFARLFFGIWLSADTSEPAMRQALLSNTAGA